MEQISNKQKNLKKRKRIMIVLFAVFWLVALTIVSIYGANAKNAIAREIAYINTNTHLTATNVQDALEQLYTYEETGQIVDPETTYLVQFECEDLCVESSLPTSQVVEVGGKVTRPSDPTYENSAIRFGGWYKDSNYTIPYDFDSVVTEDLVLHASAYAVSPITSYTITFNSNGGTGNMEDQTIQSNEAMSIRKNTFTREGYTFTGWNTSQDGTGTPYTDEQVIGLSSNITLYAQWLEDEFDATVGIYKDEDGSTCEIGLDCKAWNNSGINVALYQNNVEKYSYSSATVSGSSVSWSNVTPGTYDIYAGKSENDKTTLIDSGVDITVSTSSAVNGLMYYKLVLNAGSNMETTGSGINLGGVDTPITITTPEGYRFINWQVSRGTTPASASSTSTIISLDAYTVLYARTAENEYSIIYDYNNGTGDAYGESNIKYSVEHEITDFIPEYSGHTFAGWNTAQDGTGTGYIGGQTVSKLSSTNGGEVTLYAQWTTNPHASTVTYNYSENGGTSATKTTDTKETGQAIDLTPTATKEGYSFVGWNTNKDSHEGLSSLVMGDSDVTLFAIYRKNDSYSVSFDSNGAAIEGTHSKNCYPYNNDSSCEISMTSPSITRSGYDIIGFNTNKNGIVSDWNSNTTKTISISSNTVYYAITKKDVSVTFYANGNTISNGIDSVSGTGGMEISCPLYNTYTECSIDAPVITGSTNTPNVLGFKKQSDSATGDTLGSGTTIDINKDGYLSSNTWYAFTASNTVTYTATYTKGEGVSAIGKTEDTCTSDVTYNGEAPEESCKVIMPSITPETVSDSVYWLKDQNEYSVNQVVTINNNSTFEAKVRKTTFVVSFNTNGGSSIDDQIVERNGKVTKPSNPTKLGNTFKGWYSDSSLTHEYNFNTPVTSNLILHAKWQEDETPTKYIVTFQTNGGSSISSQTINKGGKVTKPSDPTKSGYTFVNWYRDSSFTSVYDFRNPVNSDLTLYAKWEKKVDPTPTPTPSPTPSPTPTPTPSGGGSTPSGGSSSGSSSSSSSSSSNTSSNTNTNSTGTNSQIVDNGDNTSKIISNTGNGSSATVDKDTIKEKDITKFEQKQVTGEELNKIKNLLPDAEIISAFDTDIYNSKGEKVDLSNKDITYRIPLPAGINPTDNIKLFKIVGDTKEEVQYKIENGYLVFTTKGTGRFVIATYPKTEFATTTPDSGISVKLNDNLSNIVDKIEIKELDKYNKDEIVEKYFKDAKQTFIFNPKFYDKNGYLIDISNSYIVYSVPLPKGMKETDNIYVYQIKDGKKVRLDYNIKNGKVVFGATGEGPFAIVKYADDVEVVDTPETEHKVSSWILGCTFLILSGLLIYITIFRIVKRNENKKKVMQ